MRRPAERSRRSSPSAVCHHCELPCPGQLSLDSTLEPAIDTALGILSAHQYPWIGRQVAHDGLFDLVDVARLHKQVALPRPKVCTWESLNAKRTADLAVHVADVCVWFPLQDRTACCARHVIDN